MAILKCKMCGGDLDIEAGVVVADCEYCGTKQTIPNVDNEKKMNLFNRANRLRFNNDFDKAMGVYESIVAEFPEEAESYWGLCLCKYGIEYVDDPATARKIPTCHRTSYDSIFDDQNFEMALEYADAVASKIYREEAREIERLQKAILDVVKKEEPFDIFICYKETDENGDRTMDSVLAQDVYDALTQKGYKVFFSRITLEDKLGQEYEPYIFAALTSAKVMLAFGTCYEYYNAVWVKNEWSRFLDMMKNDKEKYLIPCYRNIDAYDMPREFGKFQAQDLGKVGAVQDLVRGIEKLIGVKKSSENVQPQQVVVQQTGPDCESLLKRAFMFLEDGEWKSADEYCEKVLDIDPENARAYLGKLMVALKVKKQEELSDIKEPFEEHSYYQKAMRFADEQLKASLNESISIIKERILESKYVEAKRFLSKAKSAVQYVEVEKKFENLGNYKDSILLAKECRDKIDEFFCEDKYNKAVTMLENAIIEEDFSKGIQMLESLGSYKDSEELKKKYEEAWNSREERAYALWGEYKEIHDKMIPKTEEIEKKTALCDELRKDDETAKMQIKEIQSKSEQMSSLEGKLHETQQQIIQTNNEISSLGTFALLKKRSLSDRMNELTGLSEEYEKQISQIQESIQIYKPIDTLQAAIQRNEREINAYTESVKLLKAEISSMKNKLSLVIKKLENRIILATLIRDKAILPLLVNESSIVTIIKNDNELKNLIKNSNGLVVLTENMQKRIFGTLQIDVKAIYYQACQAMEHATDLSDIQWARGEFASICGYNDSEKRMRKCNEMIAKNTYKYN